MGFFNKLRQLAEDGTKMAQDGYARFNNAIVGQGGPANEDLASLWSQIAERYADNEKIIVRIPSLTIVLITNLPTSPSSAS